MKWWGIDRDFYLPLPPFPQVNNRYVVKQQYSNPLNKLYFSPSQPRFYSCQKLKMVLPWLRCIDIAFPSIYSLKGSYDAFLKIIILCIWCNRICWHALMYCQILYIIVGPLCPVSLSHFLQSPSFQQAQSALIGQLTQCIVIGRTPQALVGNVMPLSIIASFSFQNECKDS